MTKALRRIDISVLSTCSWCHCPFNVISCRVLRRMFNARSWVIVEINAMQGCGNLMLDFCVTAHFIWPRSSGNFSFMSFAPFTRVITDLDFLNSFFVLYKSVYKRYLIDRYVVDWNGWVKPWSRLNFKIFTWCLIGHVPRTQLWMMQKNGFNRTHSYFFTTACFFNGQCFQ